MDINVGHRTFHLAQEIVNLIVSTLTAPTDLHNVRFLCRALFDAVEEAVPTWCPAVPAEIFALSPGRDDYWWPAPLLERDQDCSRLLTLTWIQMDENKDLTGQHSDAKFHFGIMLLPSESWFGNVLAHHNDNRMRTSWGRVKERPRWLCIAQLWPSSASFEAYRSSNYCKALREWLEIMSPGCTKTALSEWAIWPNDPYDMFPFKKNCEVEIRTIFFPATMSAEQIQQFEERVKVAHRPLKNITRARAKFWWIPGIHSYQRQPAIAARLLIKWSNAKAENECHASANQPGDVHVGLKALLSDAVLKAAGAIGVQSEHCFMKPGPQVWWKPEDPDSWNKRKDDTPRSWESYDGSVPGMDIKIPGKSYI